MNTQEYYNNTRLVKTSTWSLEMTLALADEFSNKKIEEIRNALADYICSEGCSCCQDIGAHKNASEKLGELLNVPKYEDGSGHDFYQFATKK